MLCRQLGGAPAPIGGPESVGVEWVEADETEAVVERVGDQIDRIVDDEGHEPPRVLVATISTQLRDRLREAYAFVPWEGGQSTAIICENVHRVKGLEFDYVILAATASDTVTDALLYVGVSRAIAGLTVVGPRAVAERLGLGAPRLSLRVSDPRLPEGVRHRAETVVGRLPVKRHGPRIGPRV